MKSSFHPHKPFKMKYRNRKRYIRRSNVKLIDKGLGAQTERSRNNFKIERQLYAKRDHIWFCVLKKAGYTN
jgi:hypothetical protein